jgi:hypothetical protein
MDLSTFMKGGKSKGQEPPDLDPEELAMGIKVEMEHTDDPVIARKIALDHLTEFPGVYYTALKAMEEVLKSMDKSEPGSFGEKIKAKLTA